jgi:hypothetical protein
MSSGTRLAALVVAPMVALGGCVVGSVLFLAEQQALAACGPVGAAAQVDPTALPAGPVAGYSGVQLVNAAHIMNAAAALGLDARAQTIGVMTAMGESSLLVLDYGDVAGPDSRGLFQQRANGAWGSYADRMDPTISATNFFRALTAVPGWQSLEPTVAAHRVQANADPFHYAPFWDDATAVVAALSGAPGAISPGAGAPPAAPGGTYDLGPVKPHLAALAEEVGRRFAVAEVLGYRPSARDPGGHPSGLAADFMVYDDRAKGDAIAAYLITHARRLSVDYVIWRQRIWSADRAAEGWRVMPDRGSPTENHEDHPHVNVTPSPGGGSGGTGGLPCAPGGGQVSVDGWTKPAVGPVTSGYGMRVNPATGVYNLHSGTDIGAPCEAPIYAAAAGVVVTAGPAGGYGNLITVDHGGGVVSRYAHMYNNGVLTRVGDTVAAGQPIARVGSFGNSTGCHLHFEIRVGSDFTDPAPFMAQRSAPLG